ncbi:MarR family winged helix-turn-helix transcriptional regulator [Paraburkholderia azotifigens]|uniref:MarR family transcriptional regulator n=1 Tax=Paraburkholderia azotifigens TaxID=2057004 RepID=A0A5C6VH51_9BURK|nr:MarR family transcriptional regulator [Paraburkholderia azotifigens]TXC83095.1 MarR family transcriptional regulator [Paraburkholderia azotifigens]
MRHYTKDNFRLTESVGYQLVKARNLIVTEMDAALKDLDISSQQMGIMLMLRQKLASTPFELSKMLGIDTGLMTRMLDKLEAKGLVVRSRDEQDRRVVNLSLTKAGIAVADQIPDIAPDVLNARLKDFTKAELTELRRLLRKFVSD